MFFQLFGILTTIIQISIGVALMLVGIGVLQAQLTTTAGGMLQVHINTMMVMNGFTISIEHRNSIRILPGRLPQALQAQQQHLGQQHSRLQLQLHKLRLKHGLRIGAQLQRLRGKLAVAQQVLGQQHGQPTGLLLIILLSLLLKQLLQAGTLL